MRTALVLSGGGGKGAFQSGAEETLRERYGFRWDGVIGTSVGAINGTTLAHAHNQPGLRGHLHRLRCVWFEVSGNHNIYLRRRNAALGMALGKWGGLYDTTPLRDEVVGREVDPEQVASSPIRLRIGYMDLRSVSYRTVGNDHPHLREAVMASCALPLYFPPVRVPDQPPIPPPGPVLSEEGPPVVVPLTRSMRIETARMTTAQAGLEAVARDAKRERLLGRDLGFAHLRIGSDAIRLCREAPAAARLPAPLAGGMGDHEA